MGNWLYILYRPYFATVLCISFHEWYLLVLFLLAIQGSSSGACFLRAFSSLCVFYLLLPRGLAGLFLLRFLHSALQEITSLLPFAFFLIELLIGRVGLSLQVRSLFRFAFFSSSLFLWKYVLPLSSFCESFFRLRFFFFGFCAGLLGSLPVFSWGALLLLLFLMSNLRINGGFMVLVTIVRLSKGGI